MARVTEELEHLINPHASTVHEEEEEDDDDDEEKNDEESAIITNTISMEDSPTDSEQITSTKDPSKESLTTKTVEDEASIIIPQIETPKPIENVSQFENAPSMNTIEVS